MVRISMSEVSGASFPGTDAPVGWLKKIERRQGKVWVGYFHLGTTEANGRRVRTRQEDARTSFDAKHKAQGKLTAYIE